MATAVGPSRVVAGPPPCSQCAHQHYDGHRCGTMYNPGRHGVRTLLATICTCTGPTPVTQCTTCQHPHQHGTACAWPTLCVTTLSARGCTDMVLRYCDCAGQGPMTIGTLWSHTTDTPLHPERPRS